MLYKSDFDLSSNFVFRLVMLASVHLYQENQSNPLVLYKHTYKTVLLIQVDK